MKVYSLLIIIFLFKNAFPLFSKYGYEEKHTSTLQFDARDFNEGEEMHFKVEARVGAYLSTDVVEYYYVDDYTSGTNTRKYHVSFSSSSRFTEDYYDYYRKYFTITKKKSEYGDAVQGNYLIIKLPISEGSWVYIENTEEDEGKFPTWAIVLIVVIVVLFIVGIIVYCCMRRKRMKSMRKNNAATVAAATTAANIATQQAQVYQAQAYQAQAEAYQAQAQAQVYQAQAQAQAHVNQQLQAQVQAQAYQAQMNAAQTYPQQNYQAPINSNDVGDVGYSSKAMM